MSQPPVTRFTSARPLAVRIELEATRAAFHALLADVPNDQWQQKCPDSAWTIGETLSHITGGMSYFITQITRARKGRGIPRVLPPFVINRINTTMTRRGARHITPHSLAERYDAAHEQLLKMLGTMQENEWTKGASFFGEHLTIADIFHGPTRHFNEHAAIVRQTLQAR